MIWAIAVGMVGGLGGFLIVRGCLSRPLRLGDALALLERSAPRLAVSDAQPVGLEGWGERTWRKLRLPLTDTQLRQLHLQGRSAGDFFVEKLVWVFTGAMLPGVWLLISLLTGRPATPAPLLLTLLCAAGGWFVADWRLRRGTRQEVRAATDGIHTFFDLVVLERLANASGAQATANAAAVSDAPLFRRISVGLERARMEQTQPWNELRQIATEWGVTELADFADVMQLEEQGAGLSEVLQARVRELRDAHLAAQKTAAQEASESMTLWMTLPALLLGVALLAPALMTLLAAT